MANINERMLVGSYSKWVDEKVILGDSVDPKIIILFNNLIDRYDYAAQMYRNGNDKYSQYIFQLAEKINELKQFCPQICVYKNRLIFFRENTAPTIQDNNINIPLTVDLFDLNRNQIVNNYFDAQNDGISQIVIVNKSSNNLEFLIENNPVIIDSIYSPTINSFKTRYNFEDDEIMLIRNVGSPSCTPQISVLNKEQYDINIANSELVELTSTEAIFKRVEETVETVPNDTLIYIHIDFTTISDTDRILIQNRMLEWWNSFKLLNTGFQGDLIINTVRNDAISIDFEPGRGGNSSVSIQNSVLATNVETYISSPIEGFRRLAWKQGQPVTMTETQFLDYIEGKSMIHLNFQEDVSALYSPFPCVAGSFNSGTFTQPNATYIRDYSNFVNLIRPRLANFVGVVYTLPTVGQPCSDGTLLHIMAAIEATNLTSTQINNLMGTDLVNTYGAANMQTRFYTPLQSNPYIGLNRLKSLGWSGNYTKKSPAQLTVSELTGVINSHIIGSTTRTVGSLITTNQTLQDRGVQISENIQVKVRDNNSLGPLFSNLATITFNFQASCENTPTCGESTTLTIEHGQDYTFNDNSFVLETNVNKIKIDSLIVTSGELKYKNLTLTNSNLPLVIDVTDLNNLRYISDKSDNSEATITINYSTSFIEGTNYCNNGSITTLTKTANPNQPPIVSIAPLTLEAATPTEVFNNQTLDATISYSGSGGYNTYWVYLNGPTDITIGDTLQQDLIISNLKPVNDYDFRLIVTTEEDNFVVQQDITVSVTLANQAPTTDAGGDQTIALISPATSTSATTTATENDLEGQIASRQWTQISGPNTAIITGDTTLTPVFDNLIEGVYVFRITVTDAGGLTASDDLTITITSSNTPPTVSVPDMVIELPTNSVELTPTVSDTENNIDTQVWTQISGPSTATINQVTNIMSDLIEGTYIFRLTVTDTGGLSNSDDSTVTVNAAQNNPPTVNAGDDQNITGAVATLTGTATDSDGTITSVEWTRTSGPSLSGWSIVSPNSLTTQVTGLIEGTNVFRLTATDDNGNSSFDEVTLNVTTNSLSIQADHIVIDDTETTVTMPVTATDLDGVLFIIVQAPGPGSNTMYPSGASPVISPMSTSYSSPYNSSETVNLNISNLNPLGRYVLGIQSRGVGNNGTTTAVRTIIKDVATKVIDTITQVNDCNSLSGTSKQSVLYIGSNIVNGTIFYTNLESGQRLNGNNLTYRGVTSAYNVGDPFSGSGTAFTNFTFQVDNQGVVYNVQGC